MNPLVILVLCVSVIQAQKNTNGTEETECKDSQISVEAEFDREITVTFMTPYYLNNMTLSKQEVRGPRGSLLCSIGVPADMMMTEYRDPQDSHDQCKVVMLSRSCMSTSITLTRLTQERLGIWNCSRIYASPRNNYTFFRNSSINVYGLKFGDRFHRKTFEVKKGEYIAVFFSDSSLNAPPCKLIKNEEKPGYDLNENSFTYPKKNSWIEQIYDCGFRMLITNNSGGNWTLRGEFGWIRKKTNFEIIVINSSIVRSNIEMIPPHQIWFDELLSKYYFLSPFGNVTYLEIESPDKKIIRSRLNLIGIISQECVSKNDEGSWKLRVQLKNETYMREQNFNVKVIDLPIFTFSWNLTSSGNGTSYLQLTLSQGMYRSLTCKLKNQNGTISTGISGGFTTTDQFTSFFALNLIESENAVIRGEWEISCSFWSNKEDNSVVNVLTILRSNESSINEMDIELSPVWFSVRRKQLVKPGTKFEVKCIASRPLTNCSLVSPNGMRYVQSDSSSLLIEKKCSQGNEICGWVKTVEKAEKVDTGNWTCNMELEGGRRIISLVPIEVTEFLLITRYKYTANGDLYIHCRKPITLPYSRLRSCEWIDSQGNNMTKSEIISDSICGIILRASSGRPSGMMKCAARFDKYTEEKLYGSFNLSEISFDRRYEYLKQEKANLTSGDRIGAWATNLGNIELSIVILTIIVILCLCILIYYNYTKKRSSKGLNRTMAGPLNPDAMLHEQADFLPYDEEHWEYLEGNLQFKKKLGNGFFGIVVEAVAPNILKDGKATRVAVKKLQAGMNRPNDRRALEIELRILANLPKHPNVVSLLGACTKNTALGGLLVILEYCHLGNLLNYITKNKLKFINLINPFTRMIDLSKSNLNIEDAIANGTFSTEDLLKWSCQIANGMDYLSGKNVLHGDLAARNILLTERRVTKICDFGLARVIPECQYYKPGDAALPLKWMALESLVDRKFSTQSDVWSFGVLLWECFTLGEHPYGELNFLGIISSLTRGDRLEMPEYATPEIYAIMLNCWNLELNNRPSFKNIVHNLGEILDESTERSLMGVGIINNNIYVNLK